MTPITRRVGFLILATTFAVFSIASVAVAQEDGASCYPVPPGGCEPEEITCEDIIAAIAAEDPALDQNGDGVMDAGDLPADCSCAQLIDAIAAGTIDVADLPDGALSDCGCQELIDALAAGAIDAADLPDGALEACSCDELIAAVDAGTISEDLLPEDCGQVEVASDPTEDPTEAPTEDPTEEVEDEVLADTGIDAGAVALLGLVGLGAGGALVGVTRKRA